MSTFDPKIIPVAIEQEMKNSFVDYAMSVITARALPESFDGLKPVHRRLLYAMVEMGVFHDKPYKKSARIVGDTMGKYHPHGDGALYDALVRMAQPWSLHTPLIEGQGNFGSIDGDKPAQMRYTEARLTKAAQAMLEDLNKNTVDFKPNFDGSLKEPMVLPAKFPNLLVNGSSGIAVGMATNMPPHNLGEVAEAIIQYIDNPDIEIEALREKILAPDFPTGGMIYGYEGVKQAFSTGKGRIIIRGTVEIETKEKGTKQQIVVSELPYLVNKANMLEKTIKLIQEKKLEGISDIRDESNRKGMRIVYELKKEAIPQVVCNNLYKQTELQSSFSVNNVVLVNGVPAQVNLKELISHYVTHRHNVVQRRTKYDHDQAEKKLHLLEGYIIALQHVEKIIKTIKAAKDSQEAQKQLIAAYQLSSLQAKAILEMRLQKLTGLERDKILGEQKVTSELLSRLKKILETKSLRLAIIKEELRSLIQKYATPRRTKIAYQGDDFVAEDMIPNDPMIITTSRQGYIKRTPLSAYRTQKRGGVGAKGAASKSEDFTKSLFSASNHDFLLIFTKKGRVYWKKVYELPEGGKNTQGRAIQNLIQIERDDQILNILNAGKLTDQDYQKGRYVLFSTEKGQVKKTPLVAYSKPRANGILAITIQPGDRLLATQLVREGEHIILALKSGKLIRFPEKEVRSMGRTAAGVRGITLTKSEDRVVSLVTTSIHQKIKLLAVATKGYGKRSNLEDYRITHRGGKGVKALQITKKTGHLAAVKVVSPQDDLMIINSSGIAIRMDTDKISLIGRATQGVKLIELRGNDQIADVEVIPSSPEELAEQEN